MNRRSYLATTVAVALAGCTGSETLERIGTEGADESGQPRRDVDGDEPKTAANDGDEREPLEVPTNGETFDAFEEVWEWEAVAGTMYRVEEDPYAGSQSAMLEVQADESRGRIVRRFDRPIDLSGLQPGLAMATDHAADPLIQVIDTDGDRLDFRQRPGGNASLRRANFGIANVEGDPDQSEIVEIQIGTWVGEGTSAQLWIDDLHFVPRPDPGRVMIHFDGGYESTYDDALPILEEEGYSATVFVPTAEIREGWYYLGDRLTRDQVAELHDAGWTVGSYTAHGHDLTARDVDPEDELREAREWLEEAGYDAGYVAYPAGRYDDAVLDRAAEHHDLGFAGAYPAQGTGANPLCISRVVEPDPEEAQAALDRTARFGGITALRYGDLGSESRESLEVALDRIRELEEDGDLEVVSPAEIEAEFLA